MPGSKKAETPSRKSSELVEVWLVEPDQGRPPFTFEGALEFLPPDAPLPGVGDVILLPRSGTGDSRAQAFAWGGTVTPFRVVEREHVYFRASKEKRDPRNVKAARYVRTMIAVRRLTPEEYAAEPGQVIG
jgi:hypothetical protein